MAMKMNTLCLVKYDIGSNYGLTRLIWIDLSGYSYSKEYLAQQELEYDR